MKYQFLWLYVLPSFHFDKILQRFPPISTAICLNILGQLVKVTTDRGRKLLTNMWGDRPAGPALTSFFLYNYNGFLDLFSSTGFLLPDLTQFMKHHPLRLILYFAYWLMQGPITRCRYKMRVHVDGLVG